MTLRDELRNRTFTGEGRRVVALVGGSHFLNHMFLVLLPPIFGILVTEFDASLAELGFAVAVMSITSTVFQIPFGYLSDNVSRTVTLALGLSLASVGVFLVATAQVFEVLLVGQAFVGAGIGAHHPAHYPLMSAATDQDNRAWAFSIHGTAGQLGYGAAPALIVSLIAFPGRTWRDAFLLVAGVSAVYAVVSLVLLSRFVSDEVTLGGRSDTDGSDQGTLVERARQQVRSLVRSPAVLALTLLAFIVSMTAWGFRSYTTVLLTDGYDYGLTLANSVLTLMFVCNAAATLGSGLITDRFSAPTIIIPAYGVVAVGAVVAGSQALPAVVAATAIVLGTSAHSMGNPPRNKLLDNLSARTDLGVNFAVTSVGVTLGGTLAPPLFGTIIEYVGFSTAFYSIAVFGLVGIGIVYGVVRFYRSETSEPETVPSD